MDQSHGESESVLEQIVDEREEEVGDQGDPEKLKDFKQAYERLIEKVSMDDVHRTELLYNQDEYVEM